MVNLTTKFWSFVLVISTGVMLRKYPSASAMIKNLIGAFALGTLFDLAARVKTFCFTANVFPPTLFTTLAVSAPPSEILILLGKSPALTLSGWN